MSITIIIVLVVVAVLFIRMKTITKSSLSPKDACAAEKAGKALIIDVREPNEWRSGVADPAFLLPLSDLKGTRVEWGPFLAKNKDQRLLLYCQGGVRAGTAATLLASEGYRAENIGGFHTWVASDLPVRNL